MVKPTKWIRFPIPSTQTTCLVLDAARDGVKAYAPSSCTNSPIWHKPFSYSHFWLIKNGIKITGCRKVCSDNHWKRFKALKHLYSLSCLSSLGLFYGLFGVGPVFHPPPSPHISLPLVTNEFVNANQGENKKRKTYIRNPMYRNHYKV